MGQPGVKTPGLVSLLRVCLLPISPVLHDLKGSIVQKTILLVEDHVSDRNMYGNILWYIGHTDEILARWADLVKEEPSSGRRCGVS